ncbi:MAG TPA: hypothetical protein VFA20_15190 [Myxococcaceae bacterium]|nr:hypothetical protein [Myxococcaceae bacterium]
MIALATQALLIASAFGAGGSGAGPVQAARTPRPPSIDGTLSPGEWDAAAPFDRWTQQLPAGGAPPSEASELRILYDDRALRRPASWHA